MKSGLAANRRENDSIPDPAAAASPEDHSREPGESPLGRDSISSFHRVFRETNWRDGQSRAELRDNEAGAYNKRTIGDEPSRDIRRIPPNAGYLHHPVLYHRRRNPWVSPVIVIEPTPAGRVVPPQGSKKRRTIFALIGEYLSGTRTVESFPRNRGSNTGRFIGRFSLSFSFLPPRSNLARSQ